MELAEAVVRRVKIPVSRANYIKHKVQSGVRIQPARATRSNNRETQLRLAMRGVLCRLGLSRDTPARLESSAQFQSNFYEDKFNQFYSDTTE